jgi:hypothetical protein
MYKQSEVLSYIFEENFLKGLGHQMDWVLAGIYSMVELGLKKGRGWFLNFIGAPPIVH